MLIHAGRILTLAEAGCTTELTDQLYTAAPCDFDPTWLPATLALSALVGRVRKLRGRTTFDHFVLTLGDARKVLMSRSLTLVIIKCMLLTAKAVIVGVRWPSGENVRFCEPMPYRLFILSRAKRIKR